MSNPTLFRPNSSAFLKSKHTSKSLCHSLDLYYASHIDVLWINYCHVLLGHQAAQVASYPRKIWRTRSRFIKFPMAN